MALAPSAGFRLNVWFQVWQVSTIQPYSTHNESPTTQIYSNHPNESQPFRGTEETRLVVDWVFLLPLASNSNCECFDRIERLEKYV